MVYSFGEIISVSDNCAEAVLLADRADVVGTVINEKGNVDAVMNIDGEGLLLSEMQDMGIIQNCGWFKNLFKKVVKVVAVAAAVVAVAAVVVATVGATAPAVVAVGAGVVAGTAATCLML